MIVMVIEGHRVCSQVMSKYVYVNMENSNVKQMEMDLFSNHFKYGSHTQTHFHLMMISIDDICWMFVVLVRMKNKKNDLNFQ